MARKVKTADSSLENATPGRLRQAVTDGRGGRVGLKHVARAAGMSVSAVSMALADHPDMSEATKHRIRQISRELGYRRTRKTTGAPRNKITRLGFVLLGSPMQDDTYLGLFNALAAAAHRQGVRIEVHALSDPPNQAQLIDDVFNFAAHLDGLILSGFVDGPLLLELGNAGIPHVAHGHVMVDLAGVEGSRCQVIASDEVAMGLKATRHLLNAGHRRIAFVCERIPRGLWNERWLRGYHAAMVEHKMKIEPDLVQITGKILGGAGPAVDNLVKLNDRPTAYVCPDIRMAASLVRSLAAHGMQLPKQNLILSGQIRLLAQYQMEGWPWIGWDLDMMAYVLVRQLKQFVDNPMPCSSELLLPYLTMHLP